MPVPAFSTVYKYNVHIFIVILGAANSKQLCNHLYTYTQTVNVNENEALNPIIKKLTSFV